MTVCCCAGGVIVGDRLGTVCLRGVIARRCIAVVILVDSLTHYQLRGTHFLLALALVPLLVDRHKSRIPAQGRSRMHLNPRLASRVRGRAKGQLTPIILISIYVHEIIVAPRVRRLNFCLCGPFCSMRQRRWVVPPQLHPLGFRSTSLRGGRTSVVERRDWCFRHGARDIRKGHVLLGRNCALKVGRS